MTGATCRERHPARPTGIPREYVFLADYFVPCYDQSGAEEYVWMPGAGSGEENSEVRARGSPGSTVAPAAAAGEPANGDGVCVPAPLASAPSFGAPASDAVVAFFCKVGVAESVLLQRQLELVAALHRRLRLGAEELLGGPSDAVPASPGGCGTVLRSLRVEGTASHSALLSEADPDGAYSSSPWAESAGVVVDRSAAMPDPGGSQGPVLDDDGDEELRDLVYYEESM